MHNLKSDLYKEIRDAAHQKPSSFCTHRSIVRHASYWIESGIGHTQLFSEKENLTATRRKVKDEYDRETRVLDRLFVKLAEHYEQSEIFRNMSPNRIEVSGRYQIVGGYDIDDFYNRIVVSRHNNRVSVKHIIDWQYKSKSLGKRDPRKESSLAKCFTGLAIEMTEYQSQIDTLNTQIENNMDEAQKPTQY